MITQNPPEAKDQQGGAESSPRGERAAPEPSSRGSRGPEGEIAEAGGSSS